MCPGTAARFTLLGELAGGKGLVPYSVCSVTFVTCKGSSSSCIFKEEILFNPLCPRLTYTHSLELSFSLTL